MQSYPGFDEVCEGLGNKVVHGLGVAVVRTREVYAEYRVQHPDWVANSTSRGLANWIHDQLFARSVAEVEGLDGVGVVDREPTRELWVGPNYRLRIKRHRLSGDIRTFPTPGAALFLLQPQPTLDGLDEVHLVAGYEWDDELREVGPAVLSLRNGDKLVWYCELPTPAIDGVSGITHGGTTGPVPPTIGLTSDDDEKNEDDGGAPGLESA
jgi:hypothetical protein